MCRIWDSSKKNSATLQLFPPPHPSQKDTPPFLGRGTWLVTESETGHESMNLRRGSIKVHRLMIKSHLTEKGKVTKGKGFMIWLCNKRCEARPCTQKGYWKVMTAARDFLSHH